MESYQLVSGDFYFDAKMTKGFIYSSYELGKEGKWQECFAHIESYDNGMRKAIVHWQNEKSKYNLLRQAAWWGNLKACQTIMNISDDHSKLHIDQAIKTAKEKGHPKVVSLLRFYQAMLLISEIKPFMVYLHSTQDGFISLRPVDQDTIIKQLQPVHDLLKDAYEHDVDVLYQLLENYTNAYQNLINQCPTDLRWVTQIHNPHISVRVLNQKLWDTNPVFNAVPAIVDQKFYKGHQYQGHINTKSPLLNYRTSKDKAWITMNVMIESHELAPSDNWYYHLSLAKLERQYKKIYN